MLLPNHEIKKVNYSKFNLFFRSLFFIIFSALLIIGFSIVCLLSLVFPLSTRFKVLIGFCSTYIKSIKFFCNIDYEIEGLENIPKDRAGIIFSKHQSTYETFVLPLLFHEPAAVAKRELTWIPFFGWGLLVSDPIIINRSDKQSAMQQIIEKGKKCLAQGRWILFFPEGTRVPFGTIGQYRLGGTRLAVAANAPVVPVAHNAGRYWPRRSFLKYPGTVKFVIGKPIESTGKTAEQLLAEAKDWIETTMTRL